MGPPPNFQALHPALPANKTRLGMQAPSTLPAGATTLLRTRYPYPVGESHGNAGLG